MDTEILRGFVEEAESYLPVILDGVFAYGQNRERIGELKNSQRLAHTIKGAAQMVGLPEASEIAAVVSAELAALAASGIELDEDKARQICGEVMRLEAALAAARPSRETENERSADSFVGEDSAAQISDSPDEEEFDDFDIDPEMLEVFAMEAEEHLRGIALNLERLEKTIGDRAALLEIRRSAHTLKGSAGIVGFKKLSALAHRVEDLLDFMAENEIAGDRRVFELLLASTECLQALAGNLNSAETDDAMAALYRRFDEVFAALKTPAAENNTETRPAATAPPLDNAEIAAPPMNEKENDSSDAAADDAPASGAERRAVVRVSVERLDDLVRLASEMVVTRSALEQRLRETEQQVHELRLATSRLRRAALKLEVDFEADRLATKTSFAPAFDAAGAKLPNLASGEFDALEMDNYTEFHQTTRALGETASDAAAVNAELDQLVGSLGLLFDQQRRLTEEMQGSLLRLRMIPLNSIAPRLHRTVRVTAHEEGKLAELVIENEDLEIDTQILDAFAEPLLHLLKNAVAHGIETPAERRRAGKPERGRITLRTASEGTHVVFTVSDDGRGISTEMLKEKAVALGFVAAPEAARMPERDAYSLVFLPGLSTAHQVTQVSGRGVGMNVVKAGIVRRQGTITVNSTPGRGASFTVRLPASLAVTRAVFIKASGATYAIPLKLVKQVVEIGVSEIERVQSAKSVTFGGRNYRLARFNDLVGAPAAPFRDRPAPLLLLEAEGEPTAIFVEEILKPEEIVIKPLGSLLAPLREVIGASILGDGRVVPVLDLIYLLKKNAAGSNPAIAAPAPDTRAAAKTAEPTRVLVVDDSPSVRQIMSKLLKNVGLDVSTAKDGLDALDVLQAASALPAVILSDVEMPRMDGYALLAALRRQPALSRIPVVMITSRAGDKHRRKAMELGAADYLSKPFDETALLEKIKTLSGKA